MPTHRASGVLLHPTSLPGPHRIGDLGPDAYRFVDFLAASRQRLWQVLPLGPVGIGDSPYAARSAFAGNPLLISLFSLSEDGLLSSADYDPLWAPTAPADYAAARAVKLPVLRRAFERFADAAPALRSEHDDFVAAHEGWLGDYALFAALQDRYDSVPWHHWESGLARRDRAALASAAETLSEDVRFHTFLQFVFFRQWKALRRFAAERGIKIIGDVPIFVAHDSADVWSHPDLFALDQSGRPTVVAGVPPDYFSRTGQLWGNPIYDWEAMEQDGYSWWVDRMSAMLELVDCIRLDHFRGFQAYWEVPDGEATAINGRWVLGPGRKLFAALHSALGDLPFIAEDLGLITSKVEALRDDLELPGMKVLQFAFDGDPHNFYLPHCYERNCVVYTGTHDNDTARGWFESAGPETQHIVRTYLARDGHDIAWDLIRAALGSVADWAVIPLQDVLNLGSEARMNTPGRLGGNWRWRYDPYQLTVAVADRLGDLTTLYGRTPPKKRRFKQEE